MPRNLFLAAGLLVLLSLSFSGGVASVHGSMTSGVLAVGPAPADPAGDPELRIFTISVSRNGFNVTHAPGGGMMNRTEAGISEMGGMPGGILIEVNQGDRVRINFTYGDGDLRQDNPHVVTIEGYNIETGELGKKYRSEVVEFTANEVGRFRFYCSVPCLGMDNLQDGYLEVFPPKVATYIKTNLGARHLEFHHSSVDHSLPHTDILHVEALVLDENGTPVTGVRVDFSVESSFGTMKVESNVTDAEGSAHLLYPLASLRAMHVGVSFAGSGSYFPSNATATLTPDVEVVEPAELPFLSGQNAMIDPRVVGVQPQVGATLVALVAVVAGSVWLIYAYILGQLLKIWRHSPKRTQEVTGG